MWHTLGKHVAVAFGVGAGRAAMNHGIERFFTRSGKGRSAQGRRAPVWGEGYEDRNAGLYLHEEYYGSERFYEDMARSADRREKEEARAEAADAADKFARGWKRVPVPKAEVEAQYAAAMEDWSLALAEAGPMSSVFASMDYPQPQRSEFMFKWVPPKGQGRWAKGRAAQGRRAATITHRYKIIRKQRGLPGFSEKVGTIKLSAALSDAKVRAAIRKKVGPEWSIIAHESVTPGRRAAPTTAQRRKMGQKLQALPWNQASALYKRNHPQFKGIGGYPMNTKQRASGARAYAISSYNAGKLTKKDVETIFRRTGRKYPSMPTFDGMVCQKTRKNAKRRKCRSKTSR